jgi:hypothetical protein
VRSALRPGEIFATLSPTSSRLSAKMGRWALAAELEVNDFFRAGEGRFVGDGDPFPIDQDPEVGVGSVPYPLDFDEMVSVYSFHN